jgi:hypothetical protein
MIISWEEPCAEDRLERVRALTVGEHCGAAAKNSSNNACITVELIALQSFNTRGELTFRDVYKFASMPEGV